MTENLPIGMLSLKLCIVNSEKMVCFDCFYLDVSSKLMSMLTSFSATAKKLKCSWWFSFVFIILGSSWNFLIIPVTNALLAVSSDIYLLLRPKLSTIFWKYDLNVSAPGLQFYLKRASGTGVFMRILRKPFLRNIFGRLLRFPLKLFCPALLEPFFHCR